MTSTQRRVHFDDYCKRGYQDALRFATFITRDRDEAFDLVQEAMVKAFRSYEKNGELPEGRAWLQQIIRRTQIDRVRARQRRINALSLEETLEDNPHQIPTDPRLNPEQKLMAECPNPEFEALLSTLPENDAKAVRLSLREDLDESDIARQLDCGERSVRQRLARAKRYLTQAARSARLMTLVQAQAQKQQGAAA
ncbi:MAG: RNA polymerase sigma factor [Fimbriimonadaceae bacterium]|nr:RNA polymerase sigma factor [Fimbriimonadaceae bacterium]QYK54953.1 MAG: RNA polymerase sigma factor [Fimbriimonadaceae bacterium]